MCNKYAAPHPDEISSHFRTASPRRNYKPVLGPLGEGPYVLKDRTEVGQWGLIPDRSKTRKPTRADGKPLSTNNCRSEEMANKWTFQHPWANGQRCLIPAFWFDEPNWGTGKNIWWRFFREDGAPWALAGLWNDWTDPATGEIIHSYTMLTINADAHPVMRLMHKPDPRFAEDKQDKRSVISVEAEDWDLWLNGTPGQVLPLLKLPDMAVIKHGPADVLVQQPLTRGLFD